MGGQREEDKEKKQRRKEYTREVDNRKKGRDK